MSLLSFHPCFALRVNTFHSFWANARQQHTVRTSVFCQSVYCQTDGGWGWRSGLRVTTCSQRELPLLPPFLPARFLAWKTTGGVFLTPALSKVCYCCRHARSWPWAGPLEDVLTRGTSQTVPVHECRHTPHHNTVKDQMALWHIQWYDGVHLATTFWKQV